MAELKGDEIVISGISGLFPNAENMEELCEKLFSHIDMVKKIDKYPEIRHPEFPPYLGCIQGTEKFDAHFFRVTPKQALCMDPVMRKLMEHAMSALFDAGINPESVKSSRLGVYVGSPTIETATILYSDTRGHPFIITGTSKCMLSNRISYWIDGKSPSVTVDHGNAGSMSALEMAYNALKTGAIDNAIVGGANYCFEPEWTFNLKRGGFLCPDGKTKCFDKTGDGYARSDAVNVYFLQKAKDAKRIYSEVYHVKGKYFASPDSSFSLKRNPKDIEKFLTEFYSEINVNPNDVEYIEANSYGIADADTEELEAIGKVFTKENTIKVGSVKSNMGNAECASGSCSISKMCLSYHKGEIPANIHLKTAVPHSEKIKLLTKNEPFQRKFTAINNFCYTGGNYHALLKGHYKPKDKNRYKSSLPRLVLISSRKEEGVNKILDNLQSNPIDPEQLALLNNIYKMNIPGYTARGYTILDTNIKGETVSLSRGFDYISGNTRPLWFLYSGMGSQWAGMGKELLRIPVFAAAIHRCHKVVEPRGLDMFEILTDEDPTKMNILKSLVGITAVQIGLTDVLKSIGIVPDNMIGHSLGEIGCAYVDGSLTAEEAIYSAYFRALVSYEFKFIKGMMAAVGLGYAEVVKLCPPEIEVACHNSSESATISGPSEAVGEFVKRLTDQGIFAKEVASYNTAFHSKYIAEAGPKMEKLLKTIITNPKRRSNKWLSTCYLPEDWHKPEAQYASAEYLTHNLMNSVLFEEAARLIPKDALILEIAPHGLLQAIMKRSHSECINLSLTRRNEEDSVVYLLKSLGTLYQNGLNPDLESLYPKVEFPVSTETPLLSHLVEWDHDTDWILANPEEVDEKPISKEFIFSALDDEFSYLQGYVENGTIVLPEAALLHFVWETISAFKNLDFNTTSVKFKNVKFYEKVKLQLDDIVRLQVYLQKATGLFEVLNMNKVIADGIIYVVKKGGKGNNIIYNETEKHLTQNDIYTLFRIRGYTYGNNIQSIKSMNIKLNKATVKWNENGKWVNFLDALMQVQTLSQEFEGLSCVKLINSLTINTEEHKFKSFSAAGDVCYNAQVTKETGVTECAGVIIRDMILEEIVEAQKVVGTHNDLKINIFGNHLKQQQTLSSGLRTKSLQLAAKENDFESLSWTDAPIFADKSPIQVHYSGLSMKDIKKLASSDLNSFGMDFSGVDNTGRRVMGLVACGSMATSVEPDKDLLWSVPQHWSLADAATVPLPYIHALYCLAIRHTLKRSKTILVVGAAGGLGQAIISIALHMGCRVFGTVGTVEKKRFLLKLFPQLDENNIGYTYDASFRAMVSERTNNKRCNVVVSTACGTIREVAMSCVGQTILDNFFLDVNDTDQNSNENLKMGFLDWDKSYISVNLSTIFNNQSHKQRLHAMLIEGITKGYVKPLTRVIYAPGDVSRAFRLLSNRCNKGRVLLNIKDLETSNKEIDVTPRLVLHPNKAYIVVCDGSALGVELINLLIQRGAKRIIVNCSPKTINGYFHVRYALWKNRGATVEINSDDLHLEDKCQKIINDVKNLGFVEIDGIFICANGFDNRKITLNEDKQDTAVIVSNLDLITRTCKNLRYFSVISSVEQGCSNIHEEKALEKCCIRRSELGLPALFLHHILEEKIWDSNSLKILFDGLETSLKHNYVSVSTSSQDLGFNTISKMEKEDTKFDAGLNAFFRRNTKHEVDIEEPVVRMKTKVASQHELNVDPKETNIILIPGFDGNSENLAIIAERLKIPAVALQMENSMHENISEIAQKFINVLQKKFEFKSPFYLMGYSFGINIALEMAALLEKQGFFGVVYCLDSSPDAVKVHLNSYLGNLTEEQLQDSLIEHIYLLFAGHQSKKLTIKLKETKEWSDKVELFTNIAKNEVTYSHEYMRSYLMAAYNRIKTAKQYKPAIKLQSKLVLIKGIPHPEATNLSNDYNLSSYTNKPVQVFDLKSDHAQALNDCRVSNFINRTLEKI